MEEESEKGICALELDCSNHLYRWNFGQITLGSSTLFAYFLC